MKHLLLTATLALATTTATANEPDIIELCWHWSQAGKAIATDARNGVPIKATLDDINRRISNPVMRDQLRAMTAAIYATETTPQEATIRIMRMCLEGELG